MSTLGNKRRRRRTEGGGEGGEGGRDKEERERQQEDIFHYGSGLSTCIRFFLAKNHASTSCLSSRTAGSLSVVPHPESCQ